MKKTDYLSIDGKSLQLLQLIYRTGSISGAAVELGVNQSTVSHNLERLRRLLADPLFIKSGRGVVASAKMEAMQGAIEEVLVGLSQVANPQAFDPLLCEREFALSANDFEHDIVVPQLFRLMAQQAPRARLRSMISHVDHFDPLVASQIDVVLTPRRPPATGGLVSQPLLREEFALFYDASIRDAPADLPEFLACRHGRVKFNDGPGIGEIDRVLESMGERRRIAYTAPNFAALGAVIRGSELIAVCPSRLANGSLNGLGCCPVPVALEPMDFRMIWHVRYRQSAEHAWFRGLIQTAVEACLKPD
ncbi:MAG: LysR family transcriptional regulator [Granulosicoccaceae bacterium]